MKFNKSALQETYTIKSGEYQFEVLEAKESLSKYGNTMIELKLKLLKTGTIVFDPKVETTPWKIKSFIESVGQHALLEMDEITSLHCQGAKGIATIEMVSVDRFKPQPKVIRYLKS